MSPFSIRSTTNNKIAEPTIIVIFGASGDLSRRKLMPALYHLSRDSLLPTKFHVVGLGRRIEEGKEFVNHLKMRVIQYCSHKMEDQYWQPLADSMSSIKADYNDIHTFQKVKELINQLEEKWEVKANKIFYFATNPSHFQLLATSLAQVGLNKDNDDYKSRVIVEKPFGLSLETAIRLNHTIEKYFSEDQIFRIDHYLGKEAVQNLLVFRMSNLMFQPLWNREYIDHIQITTSETIGVEGRVEFFEQTGAVRDMIQSHLLQILAFLTMEHPRSLEPEQIRDEKVLLLKAVRRYIPENVNKYVVRGQYSQGVVNSEFVPAYRMEERVPKDSLVETYASVKLFIDNYRWRGVPFYLRTGKRMAQRKIDIIVQLKRLDVDRIPAVLNKQPPIPNNIRLELQPVPGVYITIGWKPAGLLTEVEPTNLQIGGHAQTKEPKAYERLLLDTMRGDSTLFIRFDEIREMWQIVDPILKRWESDDQAIKAGDLEDPFPNYPAGTQGPLEALKFIEQDDRSWTKI